MSFFDVSRASLDYQAHGIRLRVNQPLPGLTAVPATAPPDVTIDLAGQRPLVGMLPEPAWVDEEEERQGVIAFLRWKAHEAGGTYTRLRYVDGSEHVDFIIDPAGTRVWATWTPVVWLEEVTVMLLGPILGRVLRLRGVTCLHANAAAVDGRAIAFLGHKGAGKSTITAYLAHRGYPVLTDDIAALGHPEAGFPVHPGFPWLRLQTRLAEQYAAPEALRPVWQRGFRPDKQYIDLKQAGYPVAEHPLPLTALYVLGARDPALHAPALTTLPSATALLALLPHTYAALALNKTSRAQEFAALSRLADTIPIRQVDRPDDLGALPAVVDAILQDARALPLVSA